MVRPACPPDSPGRLAASDTNYTAPKFPAEFPAGSHHGFVSNWTYSKDLCQHPEIQGLHGSFIEPVSLKTSNRMFPLFGGYKLSVNNEIIIPAPMYYTSRAMFEGGSAHMHWRDKKDGLIWRGVASGGRNHKKNWKGFQRHRFISMMNGTEVSVAEQHEQAARDVNSLPPAISNFPFDNRFNYNISAAVSYNLGAWLNDFADVGFTDLLCWPPKRKDAPPACPYNRQFYHPVKGISMEKQYHYKYLP